MRYEHVDNIEAIFFDIGGTLIYKQNHGYRDPDAIDQIRHLINARCSVESLVDEINIGEKAYKTWQANSFDVLNPQEKWSRFYLKNYPGELIKKNAEKLQDLWRASRGRRYLAPHAYEVLQELSSRGYILATISNSHPDILTHTGLEGLFCANVHAQSFGKRKPHPSIFMQASLQCGVTPNKCAFIGDRPSRDLVGAREVGYRAVVIIKNEYTTEETDQTSLMADEYINTLIELLDIFPHKDKHIFQPESTKPIVMYDAALSTLNWDREKSSLNEFFQMGRKLGFARFELNHQISQADFNKIDFSQYHFTTLHNPCPAVLQMKTQEQEDRLLTSLNEKRRQSGVDILKNTIEHAWRMGARSIVIHSGCVVGDRNLDEQLRHLFREGKQGTSDYERLKEQLIADRTQRGKPHLEQLIKSLTQIVDFTKDTPLLLGIENLMHYYELPIFSEMGVLMETFQQPWVGWQFDTGHLQIMENLGLETIQAWLDIFGKRLIGLHFHDVTGIDDHHAPGFGCTNFAAIGKYILPHTQITIEVKPFVTEDEIRAGLLTLQNNNCISQI